MSILPFRKNYYQDCSSVRCREDGSNCMIDLDRPVRVFNAAPPEDMKITAFSVHLFCTALSGSF